MNIIYDPRTGQSLSKVVGSSPEPKLELALEDSGYEAGFLTMVIA